MTVRSYRRPGRPHGPSRGRSERPWDPTHLTTRARRALHYVAANPGLPRWRIAEHLGIGLSRLSILTCCALGRAYLDTLCHLPPDAHADYRNIADPAPGAPVQGQGAEPLPPQLSFSPVRETLGPAETVLAELGYIPKKRQD